MLANVANASDALRSASRRCSMVVKSPPTVVAAKLQALAALLLPAFFDNDNAVLRRDARDSLVSPSQDCASPQSALRPIISGMSEVAPPSQPDSDSFALVFINSRRPSTPWKRVIATSNALRGPLSPEDSQRPWSRGIRCCCRCVLRTVCRAQVGEWRRSRQAQLPRPAASLGHAQEVAMRRRRSAGTGGGTK